MQRYEHNLMFSCVTDRESGEFVAKALTPSTTPYTHIIPT